MKISNFDKNNIVLMNIDHGTEGTVHLYHEDDEMVALKIFHTGIGYDNNDNKELKLIILQNETVLKDDIKLLSRVYSMGQFIGFTSAYEPYRSISFFDKKSEKLKFLKLLLERVQELNSHRIYIGDFFRGNFAYENNRVKLYDIDNYRIDDLDFNVTDAPMRHYMERCNDIKNIDYFCFNCFAFSLLSKVKTTTLLDGNYKGVPHRLKTNEILDFFEELKYIDDNYVVEKTKDGKPKTLLNLIK